ncbi:FtsQ-type POTRA domain-containing protein [Paenibacillus doosanensis]|uniref:cell division protein FtsQ/DivIB n=1 Tax=Paenibacillus doosanensis TaxID=1229154 RepID=UPI00217F55A9|nr:FtsQ-type POTRA domain-containing protein [Paenibacillus doosanensis]MCS7459269.1 FtsQ-type POTRA domain-containing protein [Paenibacillus doosanensis]
MHTEERLPVIKKPKKRSRGSKRLLFLLFLFFITLLCILFFQSSLSKISEIQVDGQELLTAEAIQGASGVNAGDHFFSVSSSAIEQKVKSLKMVESVEATKHFPGVIHIQVKEYPRVAYQFGDANQPEAILADGSVVPVGGDINFVMDKPILTGWGASPELKNKLCQALASTSPSALTDISEIKPDPSESYPDKIKMYTRSQFEVITTIGYLPEKLKYLDTYIADLKENKISTGVLKLLEADTHAPFDTDAGKAAGKDGKDAKSSAGQDGRTDKKTTTTPTPTPTPPASGNNADSKKESDNAPAGKDTKTSDKETGRN